MNKGESVLEPTRMYYKYLSNQGQHFGNISKYLTRANIEHYRTKDNTKGLLLKYGFCKKLLQYKWTSEQLNTFFLPFWLVCCVTIQNVRKKCSTGQRFICAEVTSYKIHFLIDISKIQKSRNLNTCRNLEINVLFKLASADLS